MQDPSDTFRQKYSKSEDVFIKHAIKQFRRSQWLDKNDCFFHPMQGLMCLNILEILETYSKQRHSGFSGKYLQAHVIALLNLEEFPLVKHPPAYNNFDAKVLELMNEDAQHQREREAHD
jgi:hypothetical protein